MNRIEAALQRGRDAGRPLIIPFVTAGFPEADSTASVVRAMVAAGADIIELGVPFSDPLADGPTIQRASERALANGTRLTDVLDTVAELRADPALEPVPLLLMGYCNPIFRYGLEAFLERASAVGVDGSIVPDLPPEEAADYRAGCVHADLAAVFLAAPNTPDERVRLVDGMSTHFSYCVSVTGVTGARVGVEERTVAFLRRMATLARKPFVVGFGVRDADHVRLLGPWAAGVVVGSALIDDMDTADDPAAAAGARVALLRRAADEQGSPQHG
jgi:tryptophan synthase alpha chain